MAFLALSLFVALLGFGNGYFGWSDPEGYVELALIASFVFGVICGLKAKG